MDLFTTKPSCSDCRNCEQYQVKCSGITESCPLAVYSTESLQKRGRLHCTAPAEWLSQYFHGYVVPSPGEFEGIFHFEEYKDTLPNLIIEGRRRKAFLQGLYDHPYNQKYFSVKMEQFVSARGELKNDNKYYLFNEVGLNHSTNLLLSFSYRDEELNKVWASFNSKILLNQIAKLPIFGVLSPNFGPALNHARYEHIYNMDRDIYMWYEFLMLGVFTIPPIFVVDAYDKIRWREYIAVSGTPYVYLTLTKSKTEREILLEVEEAVKIIPNGVKVVITGVSSLSNMSKINNRFGKENFVYIVTGPYENGLIKKKIIVRKGELYSWQKSKWSQFEVVKHNLQVYQDAFG